jgi:ABC-type transport system involved in multi-copper enzyme maturation permease subunit
MVSLLKVDLYRLRKDKTPLIGVLLSAGLLILTLGIFGIIKLISSVSDLEGIEMLLSPKRNYIQGFQMGSNAGLVALIIMAVFTARDFTQNTLRLKIINGHSRTKIYFSTLLTNLLYGVVVILGYSIITLLITTAIFGYGKAFDSKEFLSLLAATGMSLLYVILFTSVVTAVSLKAQRMGSSIGLSIAIVVGEGFLSSLLFMIPTFNPDFPEWISRSFQVLPSIGMMMLVNEGFTGRTAWIMIISTLVLIAVTITLSLLSFKKSDIK